MYGTNCIASNLRSIVPAYNLDDGVSLCRGGRVPFVREYLSLKPIRHLAEAGSSPFRNVSHCRRGESPFTTVNGNCPLQVFTFTETVFMASLFLSAWIREPPSRCKVYTFLVVVTETCALKDSKMIPLLELFLKIFVMRTPRILEVRRAEVDWPFAQKVAVRKLG